MMSRLLLISSVLQHFNETDSVMFYDQCCTLNLEQVTLYMYVHSIGQGPYISNSFSTQCKVKLQLKPS